MDNKLHLRKGTTSEGPFSLAVTPERAGWAHSGLRVLELAPGGTHTWATGEDEMLVLPLSGAARVTCDAQEFELNGRRDVFSRISDFCYAPREATVTVTSDEGGVFAVPSARCARRLPPRYGPAGDVPVELRGAGQASRQYYLNVMAGTAADRRWLFCDDPAHAWVRGAWAGQPVDPRLPLTSATDREG